MDTPKTKELSDTGKKLEAVREELKDMRDELHRRDTPAMLAPHSGESSEWYACIAEDKAEIAVGKHERTCHGIAEVKEWVGNMQSKQNEHSDFISQYLGQQRFTRFVLPILIGCIGSAAGVGLMTLLFRGLMAGAIAGVVKP